MNNQHQTIRGAIDQLEAASDVLTKLSGLFAAIGKLGNNDTAALAVVGEYLADDWANLLDVSAETYSSKLAGEVPQ